MIIRVRTKLFRTTAISKNDKDSLQVDFYVGFTDET